MDAEMPGNRRWSFSLLTIFLLTLIAALSVSQVVMMGQLHHARQEIDAVRKEFGYIKPTGEDRILIQRIEGHEDSPIVTEW